MSDHQSHPTHTTWGHARSVSRTWDRPCCAHLVHPMTASHSKNVASLIGRHVWKHFSATKRIKQFFWQGGHVLIRARWSPPPQRGTESRTRQGKEKCWAETGCLHCSCLGFPSICDYLRTAVNVTHGQKRESEAQEGVWKSARGKDTLPLAARSPPPTSPSSGSAAAASPSQL